MIVSWSCRSGFTSYTTRQNCSFEQFNFTSLDTRREE